ncbi:unnamed protein product, partial [Owenia fusiformis]
PPLRSYTVPTSEKHSIVRMIRLHQIIGSAAILTILAAFCSAQASEMISPLDDDIMESPWQQNTFLTTKRQARWRQVDMCNCCKQFPFSFCCDGCIRLRQIAVTKTDFGENKGSTPLWKNKFCECCSTKNSPRCCQLCTIF